MMRQFYGQDYAQRRVVVGEGDILPLGKHTLSFVAAPMVHWPEVIVTYDAVDKILYSADAFGKFGALDADEPWDDEARALLYRHRGQIRRACKRCSKRRRRWISPQSARCTAPCCARIWRIICICINAGRAMYPRLPAR